MAGRRILNEQDARRCLAGAKASQAGVAEWSRARRTRWTVGRAAQAFTAEMPLDRVRRDLKERGVPMAMGSLVSFIERAADLLAPIDGLHWQQLLASAWRFGDAEDTQPTMDAESPGFISAMYLEEARAQRLGLVGEALVEHRRRLIRPLADQLERWCDAVAPTLLPSEPLMAAVGCYQRHKKALFRFIDDSNVPIDNSATERELQDVAKLRLKPRYLGSRPQPDAGCAVEVGAGPTLEWRTWVVPFKYQTATSPVVESAR